MSPNLYLSGTYSLLIANHVFVSGAPGLQLPAQLFCHLRPLYVCSCCLALSSDLVPGWEAVDTVLFPLGLLGPYEILVQTVSLQRGHSCFHSGSVILQMDFLAWEGPQVSWFECGMSHWAVFGPLASSWWLCLATVDL